MKLVKFTKISARLPCFLLRHKQALLSIIAFSFLVYFIFLYYSIGDRPWIFYNADSLYLPDLYGDLFFRHGDIFQWMFSPVPYFFPDAFLYFILAAVSHDLRIAILLFACVQFALYYLLIVAIGKEATKKGAVIFHLSALISLALVGTGYLQQETLNLALISQTHFSTALMFLLGLFLMLKTFSTNNKIYFLLLFLLCFFTTFSDILFAAQFVGVALISLCCLLLLARKNEIRQKQIYMANIFVITIASTLSYLIYQNSFFILNMNLGMHVVKRYAISDLLAAAVKIYQNLTIFYQKNTIVVLLLLLFFALALFLMIKIINDRIQKGNVGEETPFVFTIAMLFFSIVSGMACLLALDNNLMVPGYYGLRHCLPIIIFPVFLGIPLFLTRYSQIDIILTKYYGYIVTVIVISVFLITPPGSINKILKFYPSSVACLDKIAEKFDLKEGITDFYWTSRSYSFLSKRALNIAVVAGLSNHGFVPRRWCNTLNNYIAKKFRYYISNSSHLIDTDNYHPINNLYAKKKNRPGKRKVYLSFVGNRKI